VLLCKTLTNHVGKRGAWDGDIMGLPNSVGVESTLGAMGNKASQHTTRREDATMWEYITTDL